MNSATTSRTVRRPSRLRLATTTLVLAGAATIGLLSGCGAGQVSQTADKQSSLGGINAQQGDIAIRDALITPPKKTHWNKGDDAPLSLTLSNDGHRADRLVAVTSPEATSVALRSAGDAKPSAQTSPSTAPSATAAPSTPSASATPRPGGSPSTSASGSAAPSASASGRTSPTPAAPEAATIRLDLGAGDALFLGSGDDSKQHLVLQGLKKEIDTADFVTVRLTFEKAGSITLKLPVGTPTSPRARESLEHEGEEGEEGH